jgi:flagellin-like hook-associated protein FlgL
MTRIGTFAQQKFIMFHALRTQRSLVDGSIQLASGQKSQRYSGIAQDINRLFAVETAQMRSREYLHNVDVAQRRIGLTDLNLGEIEEIARQMRGILEDTGDAPVANFANLKTFATNARSLLIDLLNARDGDRYLFSGNRVDQQTATTDPATYTPVSLFQADGITIDSTFYAQYRADVLGTPGFPAGSFYEQIYFDKNGVAPTVPFPVDPNNPTATEFNSEDPALWDYYVTRMSSPQMLANPKLDYYRGDGNLPRMRISETTTISYGMTGDQNAIQQLFLTLDSIASLPPLAPPAAFLSTIIDEGLKTLTQVIDVDTTTTFVSITELRNRVLGPVNLLGNARESLTRSIDHASSVIGETEGVDDTAIVAQIQTEQTILEASFRVVSQIQSLSLTQFI